MPLATSAVFSSVYQGWVVSFLMQQAVLQGILLTEGVWWFCQVAQGRSKDIRA